MALFRFIYCSVDPIADPAGIAFGIAVRCGVGFAFDFNFIFEWTTDGRHFKLNPEALLRRPLTRDLSERDGRIVPMPASLSVSEHQPPEGLR